jgi:zinc/manganese transport system substrate-binding protein
MPLRAAAFTLAVALAAVACDGSDSRGDGEPGLLILATTSIVGDIASEVIGDEGRVEVMMSGGQDPHGYRASAQDVAKMREADLVVANGLGLEIALADVLDTAEGDGARVIRLGDLIEPLPASEAGAGPRASEPDPHFWFDPIRVAAAVDALGRELAAVDPGSGGRWAENAERYRREVLEAHERIEDLVAGLAPQNRQLVTNHDSLQYFADRYGFEVVGTVVPGTATIAEPSPAAMAELIELLRSLEVGAIFAEETHSARLADVIAAELGREVEVVELLTGALGAPGSTADTYVGFLETNARRIVQALAD